MNDRPPSGYKVEQAMATWHAARARLLDEDSALEHDPASLDELLGAAEADIEEILARLLRAARHAMVMREACATQIEDMQARKARFTRRNETFRATAFAILDALGRSKIELPDLSASIRAGQPSVRIVSEEEIPEIYVHYERKIDRQTIASVLRSGQSVPGAEMANGNPSLTIRVR